MGKPKFPSNPVIVGPGYWHLIHMKAKHSNTQQTKNEFIDLCRFLPSCICVHLRLNIDSRFSIHDSRH